MERSFVPGRAAVSEGEQFIRARGSAALLDGTLHTDSCRSFYDSTEAMLVADSPSGFRNGRRCPTRLTAGCPEHDACAAKSLEMPTAHNLLKACCHVRTTTPDPSARLGCSARRRAAIREPQSMREPLRASPSTFWGARTSRIARSGASRRGDAPARACAKGNSVRHGVVGHEREHAHAAGSATTRCSLLATHASRGGLSRSRGDAPSRCSE